MEYNNIPTANPVPQPCGPFKFLENTNNNELTTARGLYTNTVSSNTYRSANGIPSSVGSVPIEIHHIQPIKFGGHPTNTGNFVPLLHPDHVPFTTWWGHFQDDLERARGINDPLITFLNPGGHL